MPAPAHTCPKCTPENPCVYSEGEIVALRDELNEGPAPWTGMVLEVERDQEGRVYRVLWGPPPANPPISAAYAAKHSGAHRADELQRFLVPLIMPTPDTGGGRGGQEAVPHRFAPPPTP